MNILRGILKWVLAGLSVVLTIALLLFALVSTISVLISHVIAVTLTWLIIKINYEKFTNFIFAFLKYCDITGYVSTGKNTPVDQEPDNIKEL